MWTLQVKNSNHVICQCYAREHLVINAEENVTNWE